MHKEQNCHLDVANDENHLSKRSRCWGSCLFYDLKTTVAAETCAKKDPLSHINAAGRCCQIREIQFVD